MCTSCPEWTGDGPPPAKRCSRCGETKPLAAFNRLRRSKDGHQYNCRECNAAYHAENKVRHNAQIHARNRRVRAELMARLCEFFLAHPCTDCGEDDIRVLEFDHLRDKAANVSQLVGRHKSWAVVSAEIAKCEVVCANCHRRRTYARQGSHRHWWVAETLLEGLGPTAT